MEKKDFSLLINCLKEINNFTDKEIDELFEKKELTIPISVLKNRKLGILESVVYYLKTEKKLSNKEISVLLNRNNKTIWTSYNQALKKLRRK